MQDNLCISNCFPSNSNEKLNYNLVRYEESQEVESNISNQGGIKKLRRQEGVGGWSVKCLR